MPIDRKALLPREANELIQKRLDELAQEPQAWFDPGFHTGPHILYTTDEFGNRDEGLWIIFPSDSTLKQASIME
jgi:hypothetical protein